LYEKENYLERICLYPTIALAENYIEALNYTKPICMIYITAICN
jgi:hypothetical protein